MGRCVQYPPPRRSEIRALQRSGVGIAEGMGYAFRCAGREVLGCGGRDLVLDLGVMIIVPSSSLYRDLVLVPYGGGTRDEVADEVDDLVRDEVGTRSGRGTRWTVDGAGLLCL